MTKAQRLVTNALIIISLLVITSQILTSNSSEIEIEDCQQSVGAALRLLDEKVRRNRLNRNYFEVTARSKGKVCVFINYNVDMQILSFGSDPFSGWEGSYQVNAQQLKDLADAGLATYTLRAALTRYPTKHPEVDIPTRTRDIISLY